jgi:hypothetical protein
MEGGACSLAYFSAKRCDVGQRVAPAVRPLRPREVCFEINIDGPGNVPLPVVQALPLVAARVQTGSRRRQRTDRKGARRATPRLLDCIYTVSSVAQPRLLVTWWCNGWLVSGFGLKQLSARSGYAPRFYGSGSRAWSMRMWQVSAELLTIALLPVLVTYAVACCRQ